MWERLDRGRREEQARKKAEGEEDEEEEDEDEMRKFERRRKRREKENENGKNRKSKPKMERKIETAKRHVTESEVKKDKPASKMDDQVHNSAAEGRLYHLPEPLNRTKRDR